MKNSSHHLAVRLAPLLAAAVLALSAALPVRAQETFEHVGTVATVSPVQQRMTLRFVKNGSAIERVYTMPREVYQNAEDSDSHPVALGPGHFVAVSGFYRGDRPVVDNVRVLGVTNGDEAVAE